MKNVSLWFFAVLLAFAPQTAKAQVDTPSARAARAAFTDFLQQYGSRSEWQTWLTALRVEDVRYELTAGDAAEHALIASAAKRVRTAMTTPRPPVFKTLADALDARAEELAPIPRDEWVAACHAEAERYAPFNTEQTTAAQQRLARSLAALSQRFPYVARSDSPWHTFLKWEQTQHLAANPARLSARELDELETVWVNAMLVWDAPLVTEASLAVRSYIPLLRAADRAETQEEHVAAWQALAGLLENPEQSAEILRLVAERERIGQASQLTRSVRAALDRPNVMLAFRPAWLRGQVATTLNEPFRVNGVYAGTWSNGSGRLTGNVDLKIERSSAIARLAITMAGTSQTSSSGSRDGVSVSSQATTTISGHKALLWDGRGLTSRPATASANSSVRFNNINAGGGRARRSAAQGEVMASRGQAERDAEAEAERSTITRLDSTAAKWTRDVNRAWHQQFRDPWLSGNDLAPRIRVRSNGEAVRWECHLARLYEASAEVAPEFEGEGDVILQVATSGIERHAAAIWGGKTITGAEFSRQLAETFGSGAASEEASDMTMVFAPQPCTVELAEGHARLRLHLDEFSTGGTRYPPLAIEVDYAVEPRGTGLFLTRNERPRVRFNDSVATGRQQTLRLGVERKMSRLFTAEIDWPQLQFPIGGTTKTAFDVQALTLDHGWLQLALVASKPAKRTAR